MTQLRARTYRHLGNQVQQTSLLWLCALFIATYSRAGEAQTGIAGFPSSQTTTNPTLRLLVLGASWLEGVIACFWGRGRWTGSLLCYPPPGAGPGMKRRLAKPEFLPRLPSVRTRASECACAHFPFKYSADCALAPLNLPVALSRVDLTATLGESTTNDPETEAHSDAGRCIAYQDRTS